jgi:GNAT superfamily N-acetyltransferase
MPREQDVTIWYVEMLDPSWHRPSTKPRRLKVQQVPKSPELSRELYRQVGDDWMWIDRLPWSTEQWREYTDNPALECWLAFCDGQRAGYFDLERLADGSVQVVYLGLLPDFVGQGLGGDLLSSAVEIAWRDHPTRVWLHTCSLDHPSALPNYLARGFRQYDVETQRQVVPDAYFERCPW